MSENKRGDDTEHRKILRTSTFSRRQFLKRAGITVGGITLASLAAASGCKSPAVTSPPPTTTTGSPATAGSTPASPVSSTAPPASSGTQPPSSTPLQTATTSNQPVTTYAYVPPSTLPPVISITGTDCTVATDRVYSPDHIWVKTLTASVAVIGITSTMVEILGEPYKLELSAPGSKINIEDNFGVIEGYKMASDLLIPVSGTVIQLNDFLLSFVGKVTWLEPLDDPYNLGWMMVVQLSQPDELKSMLDAQSYRDLVKK